MATREDLEFGKTAVALGWLHSDQLAQCLQRQQERSQHGEALSLSQLLLKNGYLTVAQVAELQKQQSKVTQLRMAQPPPAEKGQFVTQLRISPPQHEAATTVRNLPTQARIPLQSREDAAQPGAAGQAQVQDGPGSRAGSDDQAISPAEGSTTREGAALSGPTPQGEGQAQPQGQRPTRVAPAGSQTPTIKLGPTERSFGRYQLLAEIGRGGMGLVYKAYDSELNRLVALKMLIAGEFAKDTEVERFLREAQATARLRHPNIVMVYDMGSVDGVNFFTMDFIEGVSLHELIEKSSPSLRQSVELSIKIGQAIHYAHSQGVIHRDLKPANVMIDAGGEPKVMDFGLAKVTTAQSQQLSQSGMLIGTVEYMAPEQAQGRLRAIDARTDVYALGAILYEMLTSRPPFHGTSFTAILDQIVHRDPAPPSAINPIVPKALDTICLKALEKSKELRYPNASAWVEDLARFSQGQTIQARSSGIHRRLGKAIRRHKVLAGVFLVVFLCLLALIIGVAVHRSIEEQRKQIAREQEHRRRQANIAQIIEEVNRFFVNTGKAEDLLCKYPKDRLYREISLAEEEERRDLIKRYGQLRARLEQTLVLEPQHKELQQCLYQVEKEIGLLALGGRNYLLAELSFERCQSLGWQAQARELLAQIEQERNEVIQSQVKRIQEIMTELGQSPPEAGIVDEYVTEIVRMRCSRAAQELVAYLSQPNEWQRRVAIEVLGKLGDRHTQVNGKDAVEWLMQRLETMEVKKNPEETQALIWALGRLRDGRANALVNRVRHQVGSGSAFWRKTEIPYRWIPLDNQAGQEKLRTAQEWAQQAEMKYNKDDWEGSIADCSKAIALNPQYVQAYNLRGLGRYHRRELDGALADYNLALTIDPTCAPAYNNRGYLHRARRDFAAAIADFTKAIELDGRHADAYNNRGDSREEQGDLDGAIADYNRAVTLNPKMAAAFSNRGRAYFKKGDLEEALRNFNEAIAINPRYDTAYNNRGSVYHRQGKLAKAIADYSQALEYDPRNVAAYGNRGKARYEKNDFAGAIADFTQVIALHPKDLTAYNNRGASRLAQGDVEGAMADYNYAISLDSRHAATYFNRAVAQEKQGHLEAALTDYTQAITLEPLNGEYYAHRGQTHYLQKKWDAAIADFTKAISLNPKEARNYNNRGSVYFAQGNRKKALEDYNEALRLNPKFAKAYVSRGDTRVLLDEVDGAMADYNQAISLNPREALAYKSRSLVHHRQKNYRAAVTDLRTYLQLLPGAPDAAEAKAYIQKYGRN